MIYATYTIGSNDEIYESDETCSQEKFYYDLIFFCDQKIEWRIGLGVQLSLELVAYDAPKIFEYLEFLSLIFSTSTEAQSNTVS